MRYLLLILFSNSLAREWIDPHDMDTKHVIKDSSQDTNQLLEKPEEQNSKSHCLQPAADDITFVYLKRVISLLLSSATSDDQDISKLKGKYFFNKDGEDYTFLMKFTSSEKNDPQELRKLDSVLKDAFSKKFSESVLDILVTTNIFFSQLLNADTLTIMAACTALYIFYHLLKTNFSFGYIFKYFLFIIWIIDYAFRYQNLSELAKIHNVNVISAKCKDLSWFEYYFSKVDEKCEKKVVTPLEVALLQLKHVIIIPLSSLGTGTGQFMSELWSQLPFPYNIVMFPVILLLLLILVPAIMTVVNGQSFKINIMHLFHVQFGNQNESGPTLEKLYNALEQRSSRMDSQISYSKKLKDRRDKQGKLHKYPKIVNKGKSITFAPQNVKKSITDTETPTL